MRRIVSERRRCKLEGNLKSTILEPSEKMSGNRNKTVMCHVCEKVMRGDHLKRHTITKHGSAVSDGQRGEAHQLQSQATFATAFGTGARVEDVHQDRSFASDATEAYNQHDQATAAILTCPEPMKTTDNVNASLEYELVRDNETYTYQLEIGRQVSAVLRSGKIMEKSLSKHNKFCLELFRACQPTTDYRKI